MNKVAVIYWSGTGNTEAMANAVVEGARDAGADVTLFQVSDFFPSMMDDFDAFAFGCPAMGDEELEDIEFAPVYDACEMSIKGRKAAIFGSYSWNDGEWIRKWDARIRSAGADIVHDYVMCSDYPDDDAILACKELGAALAN